MNVIEHVKTMEGCGEQFYRHLASQMADRNLNAVLNVLADDELRYCQITDEMPEGSTIPHDGSIYEQFQAVFSKSESDQHPVPAGSAQQEIYRLAVDSEQQAVDAYLQLYGDSDSEQQRDLLAGVIGDKRRHIVVLQSLIEYLREPKRWLEEEQYRKVSGL